MPNRPSAKPSEKNFLSKYYTQSLTKKNAKPKLSLIEKLKIRLNVFQAKRHSHYREDARRRRQIEKGIIHVNG